MFRLLKINTETGDRPEVFDVNKNESQILLRFVNIVLDHASNSDDYTCGDIEAMKENREERVGSYIYKIDEVDKLTDKEIVAAGGGVCAHCHSDQTNGHTCEMNEGYVERTIDCDICGKETVEQYSLSGVE